MKQTMDDMMKKASHAADTAIKATSQLVAKGRDQVDKLALQNRIGRLEKQLGALVYTMRKGSAAGSDDMIDWYVEEIDRLKKQLAAFETPPPSRTSVHKCLDAGTEATEDAMFCGSRGAELSTK